MAKYLETRSAFKLRYTAFRYWVRDWLVRLIKQGRFARFDLDRKLARYLNRSGGFFVELGANDGKLASNTYHLEYARGWSGVLVEPVPHLYLKCLKERGKKSQVFCNACVGFEYNLPFLEVIHLDSMSVSRGLDLDVNQAEHEALGNRYIRDGSSYVFGAQARTLNSILKEANAPKRIDFLSLDVEGAELEVLKGIDFSEYEFTYMLIECREPSRLRSFLQPLGYSEIDVLSHHDFLFSKMS